MPRFSLPVITVMNVRLKPLLRAIAKDPWSSVQDAVLVASVLIVALLLVLQYDLFQFVANQPDPHVKITLAEAIFLTCLLALCILAFVLRRLGDERRDVARRFAAGQQVRELKAMALEDALTGLANRRALLAALAATTASPSPNSSKSVLFLMDLDEFKRVNDVHGHALGDRVLKVVAQRFQRAARPGDLLARLGGDEFAVLAHNVDRESALAIGRRFIVALANEIGAGGHSHAIGVSIGAALIPDDGITAEEIIHKADLAMYRAKGQDLSSLEFFEEGRTHPRHTGSG